MQTLVEARVRKITSLRFTEFKLLVTKLEIHQTCWSFEMYSLLGLLPSIISHTNHIRIVGSPTLVGFY